MLCVVADASSLILLEKITLLDTLLSKNIQIMIPPEVQKEAVEKGKLRKFPDAFKLEEKINKDKIAVREVKDQNKVKKLMTTFKVEKGEAEAIALFQQEKADILATDDRFAILSCHTLSIPVSGSTSWVTASFEKGYINKNQGIQMIETLAKEGRYKDEIIFQALHTIQGGSNEKK